MALQNDNINGLKDYMFTSENLSRITKHMIDIGFKPPQHNLKICCNNNPA